MTFEHLKSIYRDFDIRGQYPTEINDEEVYKIAKALVVMIYAPQPKIWSLPSQTVLLKVALM
jgi:phosphomannomutase